MVSFTAIVAITAVALFSTADAMTESFGEGLYFRPPSFLTSGDPANTNAFFRRTPCPALNALANHGYLPRDGKNITNAQLRDVVIDKFNLDLPLASLLVSVLPPTFDLNLLGTHGLIEHDASLVHADSYLGADPSKIDQALLADVLKRADAKGEFSVATFGQIRKERIATCKASNPNCTFGPTQTFLAFGESALILNGFGNGATETVGKDTLTSFLQYEMIPFGFKKPELVISQARLGATSAKIQAVANAV